MSAVEIIHKDAWVPQELRAKIGVISPWKNFRQFCQELVRYLPNEQAAELMDRLKMVVLMESELRVAVIRSPLSPYRLGRGLFEDYGVTSRKVVTTAGVGFIVDAFQNLVELENMKYHGLGTGSTAEASSDTALVAELTTQYNPNSTRATGTTAENAANIYETVATNTLDGAATVEEHGVFSAATAGALLDRSLTGTQTLASGDGLQSTYRLTLTAGS